MTKLVCYYLPQKINAVTVNVDAPNWNLPMHTNSFIIYKHSTNKIQIQIWNTDRKPAQTGDVTVYINVMKNNILLLTKPCTIIDPARSVYEFSIGSHETTILPEGTLYYSLWMQPVGSDNKDVLVLDQGQQGVGTFQVKVGPFPDPRPTRTIDNFLADDAGTPPKTFYNSGPIRIADYIGNELPTITFAVYMTNFTGKFWVLGTIQEDATRQYHDWFRIDLNDMTEIVFNKKTGIEAFNIHQKITYLNFLFEYDPDNKGTLDKILLRD